MSWILAIFAFGALIALHEAGHMWVARRMGMRVDRYSIGFGPAIFRWRRGHTEYVLSAIPIGGYVQVAGMAGEEDGTAADDPESYVNKPVLSRMAVVIAGPVANYLTAFLIGVPLLMGANEEPLVDSTRLGEVVAGEPAAAAGLREGDVLRAIGGVDVKQWNDIPRVLNEAAKKAPGQPLVISFERGGVLGDVAVKPREAGDRFVIGVAVSTKAIPGLSIGSALPQALENMWLQSAGTLAQIGKMIRREAKVDLAGPLGILSHTADQAKRGMLELVKTVWFLSVAIGLFNVLPLPALDGGRLVFLTIEALSRRKVNQRVEAMVHSAGMVALLVLMVFVTYGDIMKKFTTG